MTGMDDAATEEVVGVPRAATKVLPVDRCDSASAPE
jgi:hypothetical protein